MDDDLPIVIGLIGIGLLLPILALIGGVMVLVAGDPQDKWIGAIMVGSVVGLGVIVVGLWKGIPTIWRYLGRAGEERRIGRERRIEVGMPSFWDRFHEYPSSRLGQGWWEACLIWGSLGSGVVGFVIWGWATEVMGWRGPTGVALGVLGGLVAEFINMFFIARPGFWMEEIRRGLLGPDLSKEYKPTKYQAPFVTLNVKGCFFVSAGVSEEVISTYFHDWRERVERTLKKCMLFHRREFKGDSELEYTFEPEPIRGSKDWEWYAEDLRRLVEEVRESVEPPSGRYPIMVVFHPHPYPEDGEIVEYGRSFEEGDICWCIIHGSAFASLHPVRESWGTAVVYHEIGHCCGLDDTDEPLNVMRDRIPMTTSGLRCLRLNQRQREEFLRDLT